MSKVDMPAPELERRIARLARKLGMARTRIRAELYWSLLRQAVYARSAATIACMELRIFGDRHA